MVYTTIIKVNIPYPMVYNFSVEASKIDVVPNRAMKLLRKRLREEGKHKHLNYVDIQVSKYE